MENKENVAKATMKEMFKGYTFYSEDEYKSIWEDAIIVIDTNILLNLYRYSAESRKEIIHLLKSLKKRIWIPYQVAKEYFKCRDKVIKDSFKELETLKNQIEKAYEDIEKELKNKEKNYTEVAKIEEIVNDSKKKIKEEFDHINDNSTKNNNTKVNFEIENEILKLINDNIGEAIPVAEYEKMIDEGEIRIKNQLPPGYKDNDKKERYNGKPINGDYIVFKSFLNYAKENGKDIIFITDDVKEDWFLEVDGERKGGRPELLHEFYLETGKLLLIYSFEGFANKYSELNPSSKLSEEAISEIYEINTINAEKVIPLKDYIVKLNFDTHLYDQDKLEKEYSEEAIQRKQIMEIRYLKRIIERIKNSNDNSEIAYKHFKRVLNIIIANLSDKDEFIKEGIRDIKSKITFQLLMTDKDRAILLMECIVELLEERYF